MHRTRTAFSTLLAALLLLALSVMAVAVPTEPTPTPPTPTPSAPAPTITSLSQTTAVAGSDGFTLTVTGTNFVGTSRVIFGNVALANTYVSATSLTAAVPGHGNLHPRTLAVLVYRTGTGASPTRSRSRRDTLQPAADRDRPQPGNHHRRQRGLRAHHYRDELPRHVDCLLRRDDADAGSTTASATSLTVAGPTAAFKSPR